MQDKTTSTKRIKIDKANANIVIIIAIASFVTVFSLFAIRALASQYLYQRRVTSAQTKTVNQLVSDSNAVSNLVNAYNSFASTSQNIIGGNPKGTGSQDGNSTKIILDSLPSSYDFPALVTSIQNLLNSQNVTINSISGTDSGSQQVAASNNSSTTPVAIPFQFTAAGTYQSMQNVINTMQLSVRPLRITNLDFTGSDNTMTMNVSAETYYQPASGLNISSETIK